jgi:uncharacterized delta-60 repeat protein
VNNGSQSFWVAFLMLAFQSVCSKTLAQLTLESPTQVEKMKGTGSTGPIRCLPGGAVAISNQHLILTNDWSVVLSTPNFKFPFAVQSDGKIVCLGNTNNCVVRLNLDGTLDSTFDSASVSTSDLSRITDIQVQADDKVLVGCVENPASTYAGINNGLFRLNPDGNDDPTFTPARGGPLHIIPLPDGKILADFGTIDRLLTNGVVDETFNNNRAGGDRIAVQPDGKIVLAGSLTRADGFPRPGLARLMPNGSLDFDFNPTIGPQGPAIALSLENNGAIVVATGNTVQRWFADGQLDPTFKLKTSQTFLGMDIDSFNRIIISYGTGIRAYSGHERVLSPAADMDTVFQTSSTIDAGWTTLQAIPANTPLDYVIDAIFPGTGSTFFRITPAQ